MDGIIFDVDGTLWDSTDTVAKSWNQVIAGNSDLDIRLDGGILKNLFGKTMDEIYNTVFPTLPKEEQDRLGALCFAHENKLLETEPGTVYEGTEDTLRALAGKMPVFIVSNCQCGYIEVFLKVSGLGDIVKDHLCFGETLVSKGQSIRMLMERNQLKDVVYVGDTQGDFLACQEAGIPFIFAKYGFGEVPQAKDSIDHIFDLQARFL
ncbi:HAD family hydrolase [Luxibacter massiliensis]|uniref:HAD family hydrolase n=1 Tax=Luxibacter massiliensis TaxID=2219695 RepID=UPI000F05442D|nr:HAD family hydrolase [Luxibacter massiliensis]